MIIKVFPACQKSEKFGLGIIKAKFRNWLSRIPPKSEQSRVLSKLYKVGNTTNNDLRREEQN